jgi:hypothetical protein
MWGANAQNGSNHMRMRNTPSRRRIGDRPADFAPSVVDVPSRMLIPDSVEWARTHALARHGDGTTLLQGAYDHPWLIAGYLLGSDRGSPNDGSTLLSKRVMAQIRSPVRVRTSRPIPWRMPVGARR